VREREGRVAANKTDEELQFNLQLLSEVLSVRNSQLYRYEYQPAAPLRGSLCEKLTALQVRVSSTCLPRTESSNKHFPFKNFDEMWNNFVFAGNLHKNLQTFVYFL
jgi:hypothetical protein